jgi:hypothetical protein
LTGASGPDHLPGGRKVLHVIQGDAVPQRFIEDPSVDAGKPNLALSRASGDESPWRGKALREFSPCQPLTCWCKFIPT